MNSATFARFLGLTIGHAIVLGRQAKHGLGKSFTWAANRPAHATALLFIFASVPIWGLAIMGRISYWYPLFSTLGAILFVLIAFGLEKRVGNAFLGAFLWILRMIAIGIGRIFGSIFKHKDPGWFTALTLLFLIGTVVGQSLLNVSRDLAIILYSIGFTLGGVGAIVYLTFYWKRPVKVQGAKLAMLSLASILIVISGLLWTFTPLNGSLALIYLGATGMLQLLGVAVFAAKENI
jgi:hypothetical protein